jgi:lipopolysaccharide export system permease protein
VDPLWEDGIAYDAKDYRRRGGAVVGLSRLSRYLLRELLGAWLAVTLVLLVVLLTNRLIQFMADAASGEIAPGVIFTLLGLKAAANLGVVLPGSFFLAAVLALARLYRDSEVTAMAGCGVGPLQLYRGVFALALPLAIGVGGLTLSLGPAAERLADQVLVNAEQQAQFAGVRPGRFTALGADTTVYVAEVSESGDMRGVFIERALSDGDEVWVAEKGRRAVNALAGGEFLVLEAGWRYAGTPGAAEWQLMRYATQGVRIREPEPIEPRAGLDALSLPALLARDDMSAWAELQTRLSFPLMVLVLALGSLPLARTDPRQGRYAQVVSAVLLFMVYFNLLYTAQDWLAGGQSPAWLGLIWVHGLAALLAFFALRWRFNLGWRARRYREPGA